MSTRAVREKLKVPRGVCGTKGVEGGRLRVSWSVM